MTAMPSSFSSAAMPATKPFVSATWASTLLAWMTSACLPSARQLARPARRPKNSARLGTPIFSAASHSAGDRVDAQHRDALLDVVLQQVAVVAGQLDDQAVAGPGSRRSISSSTFFRECSSRYFENDEKYG